MEEQDTEYLKLPIEERCQHKSWKARINGYEAAAKLFQGIADEKSPEWSKYLGLVKKFVVDSNAVAQEKGLDTVLIYVESAACAGKTCSEVVSGIVAKCLSAPKVKTKEKGVAIILMYIEIEKHELVQEELIKGFGNKTPKIVAACIQIMREALREFGSKVIALKPVVKSLCTLLEDRDKSVRDEAKLLAVEIFRWIGAAFKPQLASLKPVMLTELEAEFEKVAGEKPAPTRYLRSQQEIQLRKQTLQEGEDEIDGAMEEAEVDDFDPYEMMEAVNILSKLPNDFYEKCEAKKWQDRKEALDALQQLTSNIKLEAGDYGDLIIGKDANVVVVGVAGKCLAGLANGLKMKFHPFANQCVHTILDKFKEKKQNVVLAMRESIDAIYQSTSLEAIQEDIITALDNKNPSIKAETASFMTRCFCRCNMVILNKKLLKVFSVALIKTLNDTDPTVRENAAEALGTAMKVVGEKIMTPFIAEVDALKMNKVKECFDKAIIVAPKNSGMNVKAAKSAPNQQPKENNENSERVGPKKNLPQKSASVPVANRKTVRGGQKIGGKKMAPTLTSASSTCVSGEIDEKEMTPEEVDDRASNLVSADILKGIVDGNWKLRLTSMEQFLDYIKTEDKKSLPVQVLIRTIAKKPGFKDNNFQVLKIKMDAVVYLASSAPFSRCAARFCILDIADKLGDSKNGASAGEALSVVAEATKLEFVGSQVLEMAFGQKNPKTQAETMIWLAGAIKEFGMQIQIKSVTEYIKKGLAATNPTVRTASISLLGVMYLYVGASIRTYFDTEKGILLQQIDAEFEKLHGMSPPAPTRGISNDAEANNGACDEEGGGDGGAPSINIADLIPRTDICVSITPVLIQEMTDKNWKVRGEALQKLANIISEAKFITPNLGDLPPILKMRLVDSNRNLAVQALNICQAIGTAMGPNCTKYVRILAPGMIISLGDTKTQVRSAGLMCLNAWLEQCGLASFVEGDLLAENLKLENPSLRAELLGWLAITLPQAKNLSPDLALCIPYLFACVEDRNSDVRKKAQDAVLPFMIHLGYDKLLHASAKLKPASKSVVVALLEKTKASLPQKPAAKPKAVQGAKVVKPTGNGGSSNGNNRASQEDLDVSAKAQKNGMKRATSRTRMPGGKTSGKRKDDDVDPSPSLQANCLKDQRLNDEQRLKVLKWNFTAPRDEFYDQLKDQMTTAGVNRNLLANMFHNDFKFHIRAIETLIECAECDPDATIANLDLILKWITLRFFDTNPSVLLKGLEYLQNLFILLAQQDYHLVENEANAFIPYLVMKVGDPKDTVRQSVRNIMKQICKLYPSSKVFSLVMEGLKSKNARQRTECLDELGNLIESYGINVCQPSVSAALKEVTRHISDRDNGVRNAALNCVVSAYVLEGEKIYKIIGPISDKDLSLLGERIKRSSRSNGAAPPTSRVQVSPESARVGRPTTRGHSAIPKEDANRRENEEHQEPVVKRSAPLPSSRPASGMFTLDLDKIEQMMQEKVETQMPCLIKPDLEEVLTEMPIRLPESRIRPSSPATKLLNNTSDVATTLDFVISQTASNDINKAVNSLAQIDEFLKDESRAELMQSCVDQLILAESLQLRMVYSRHMSDESTNWRDLLKLYRCLTMTLVTLFSNRCLATRGSTDVLRDLIYNLISVLLDERLNGIDDGPHVVRSINVLIVKVVERSNPTNILTALIKLLSDCVGKETCSSKFTELVMKCMWKMLRMVPNIIDDLNLDKILLELHIFLKAYPSAQWKDRSSDTPLRTIKTVIHTLVLQKGNKIMSHLSLVENLHESELEAYLQRFLKSGIKHRTSDSSKKDGKSPKRLSKTTHEMLAEIFKKIGSKEYTKEGLADLYDFKRNHPEADIEPFLRKSSQFFQNYIERGLKGIENIRESQSSSATSTPVIASRQNSEDSVSAHIRMSDSQEETVGVYMERLKVLRARCGYDNTMYDKANTGIFNKGSATPPEPLFHGGDAKKEEPMSFPIGIPRSESSDAVSTKTGSDVDELKQRLARIKNSAKI
uniref:TOG domain-containing protein n=1 Tax=Strigamia maritima TaxID=126957 RepID=T1JI26_STRMM